MKRTGVDDGPALPSERAIKAACDRIDAAAVPSDADRINWIEKQKYIQTGIGWDGKRYAYEVRTNDRGLRRFFGRTMREALDVALRDK